MSMILFPKVFRCTRLFVFSLLMIRGKLGRWKKLTPLISVRIYLLLFIMTFLFKLHNETKSRVGHRSVYTALRFKIWLIISVYLNAFFTGCVSSFGNPSSDAFFAHRKPPSGTAIIQVHSILRGTQKGTRVKKSWEEGFKKNLWCNWNTQWHFLHASLLSMQHA